MYDYINYFGLYFDMQTIKNTGINQVDLINKVTLGGLVTILASKIRRQYHYK